MNLLGRIRTLARVRPLPEGEVGSDEEHRAEERVQKLTDEHVHEIDELLKRKEAEILEV